MFNYILDLITLTKPKVLLLMISTCYVGVALSTKETPSLLFLSSLFLGIYCIAGCGATLNHIFDRFIDAKMGRTQQRPIAKARISLNTAIIFCGLLFTFGTLLLLFQINWRTWALTVIGSLGYGLIYTRFLKFATPQNIVIGGLSGALPPLLGWSALNDVLEPMSWILVAIIFTWTPIHFWALCLAKEKEYCTANIPMLPVTHGYDFTSFFIILYNILLYIICLFPWLIGFLSWRYMIISLILNTYYLMMNILIRRRCARSCYNSFVFSIAYLYILFFVMLIDRRFFYE